VRHLADALRTNSTLQLLILHGIEPLFSILSFYGSLCLSGALTGPADNQIRSDDAQSLAEALKFNTALQSLDVGGESFVVFSAALMVFEENELLNAGARCLADALKANAKLQSLQLNGVSAVRWPLGADGLRRESNRRRGRAAARGRAQSQHDLAGTQFVWCGPFPFAAPRSPAHGLCRKRHRRRRGAASCLRSFFQLDAAVARRRRRVSF
jgi:hypothetical protein